MYNSKKPTALEKAQYQKNRFKTFENLKKMWATKILFSVIRFVQQKKKKFATKNIFEIKPMKVCFRHNLKFSLDSLSAKFQPLGINSMNASQLVRYNYWYFYH